MPCRSKRRCCPPIGLCSTEVRSEWKRVQTREDKSECRRACWGSQYGADYLALTLSAAATCQLCRSTQQESCKGECVRDLGCVLRTMFIMAGHPLLPGTTWQMRWTSMGSGQIVGQPPRGAALIVRSMPIAYMWCIYAVCVSTYGICAGVYTYGMCGELISGVSYAVYV